MTNTPTDTTTAHGFTENLSPPEGIFSKTVSFFRRKMRSLTFVTGISAAAGGCHQEFGTNNELVDAGFSATACEGKTNGGEGLTYYKFGGYSCDEENYTFALHGINDSATTIAGVARGMTEEELRGFASIESPGHGGRPLPESLKDGNLNPVKIANFLEEFLINEFANKENTSLICHSALGNGCIKALDYLPNTTATLVNPALTIFGNEIVRIPSRWVGNDCKTKLARYVTIKGAIATLDEGKKNGPELIALMRPETIERATESNRCIEIKPGTSKQTFSEVPCDNSPVERLRINGEENCKAQSSLTDSVRRTWRIREWAHEVMVALIQNRHRIKIILDPSDSVLDTPLIARFLEEDQFEGIEVDMIEGLNGGHSPFMTQALIMAQILREKGALVHAPEERP